PATAARQASRSDSIVPALALDPCTDTGISLLSHV
ncbi:MAG: hypothetical protein JWR13_4210, partial [Mycobacterium sp.]|nr:hypothetical protein [Mycobacterium sp.]